MTRSPETSGAGRAIRFDLLFRKKTEGFPLLSLMRLLGFDTLFNARDLTKKNKIFTSQN
ncbi:hypothetical protein SAMN04487979_1254 [Flavobacterium sp. ov086]|nr:hypothetical protein SAMN04487979_1254 [Flavobacterium sp. ov086]